ncbi:MAG: mechanosensitive ion channel family protein [Alphaproteobacteria bacterium]|nr:mechanosensitive ion channel family protein [Alphaproteobacteria bacterium]
MPGLLIGRALAGLCIALFLVTLATGALAQAVIPGGGTETVQDATPEIPSDLSPEAVDALLSRLTDAEIRAILSKELHRRADERVAAQAATPGVLMGVRDRLAEMAGKIEARLTRWSKALANIGERRKQIAERLARAEDGVAGMIAASLAVLLAGLAAAAAVIWATRNWRGWLMTPQRGGYWDSVVRTIALGIVEFAPIVAFDLATVSLAPMLAGALGPMVDYVWIYEVGVTYSWGFIVLSRRAFAPDAPAIRIAPLSDADALRLHHLIRRAVQIGAAGWLIAGLSPTLGLGFPPGLITVALTGTAVAVLLIFAAARSYRQIQATLAEVLLERQEQPGALARIAVAAVPATLIIYLTFAWLYWLANWIESGQQHLLGPAGTVVLLLTLPIFDRLGRELVRTLIRSGSPAAERYRAVFRGVWRMLIGIIAVFIVVALWGLNLYALAKGEDAPGWADMLFDIAVTLLIARFVWQLILAALYRERHAGGEEEGDGEVAAASRLDTLVPLFRNLLLTILVVVVVMIVLSSAGVNIGPLLASAGIVGIAVGFGAQTLVRDIFSGAFFLIDDAFRVGEYIELDEKLRGEVEAISIRSFQLRHHRGPVITVPFGELRNVINHSRDWVIYKMSFRMEPDTDPVKVKKLVKKVGAEFMEHPEHGPKFFEPLKSQGVYMIDDDSALIIRVKFKCRPRTQFVLRREIYHRLREVFAENGIHLARRKVEVVASGDGEAPPPAPLTGSAVLAEDAVPGAGSGG